MPESSELQTLVDYHYWANRRILGAVAALTPEQFARDLGNSFPSIQATLAHLISAEVTWLSRMLETSLPAVKAEDIPDVVAARVRWQETEARLRQVAAAGPGDLDKPVVARYANGQVMTNPRWQVIQQLVTHGSYHRGQIVTLLRQLGAAPVQTDLLLYYRQQAGQL